MDPRYQEQQLQFLTSHNNGSTIGDIILAGLPLHLSPLLTGQVALWSGASPAGTLFRLFEAAVLVVPPVLSFTVLADMAHLVSLALLIPAIILIILNLVRKKPAKEGKNLGDLQLSDSRSIHSITNYRSSMLLVTAICILAVDFPAFPRRFAKTAAYGYSLMDLGVGGFMFAAGLVAPEARGTGAAATAERPSMRAVLMGCLPLLLLGVARLVAVSLTGYHENVTEYGQHWNFFFTLAAVKILSAGVMPHLGGKSIWTGSVVIAILYEGLLSFGMVDWILSDAPRDDLLSANREGLCSSLGYLAIYLAGVSWGRELLVFPFTFNSLVDSVSLLLVWSVVMWLSLAYSTTFFLPPSRRLANYTFYTWTVAYNLSILTLFLIVELIHVVVAEKRLLFSPIDEKKKERRTHQGGRKLQKMQQPENTASVSQSVQAVERCPQLYRAISYNSLAFFLIANLATGAVNMTVATIHTEGCLAVLILLTYLSLLSLVTVTLHTYRIRLKFW